MHDFVNTPFNIGNLQFPHRLVQGPLAGFSCAPFRTLFYHYTPPAYCVSEMISAHDVVHKHASNSRYLLRAPAETTLCYQIAGRDPNVMAAAASRLQDLGADLIDLNCGCPKAKIRKKGAGSALLDEIPRLMDVVVAVRAKLRIPLTVKIRLQRDERDLMLAEQLEQAGVDALIVHGRHWTDDYSVPCDAVAIAAIKQAVNIPVIANGDIADGQSLSHMVATGCDGFMIARAGSGQPWLYRQLLAGIGADDATLPQRVGAFIEHLQGLTALENEQQAILQSKRLVRYYFRFLQGEQLAVFYSLTSLYEVETFIHTLKFDNPPTHNNCHKIPI